MAEVRVWNRTLTKEEINAENHFYSVPVDSEGLVGYWKLNDGAGAIVKDSSPSGNDMVGEINVRSSNGQQIGDEGMNWVEMSLPLFRADKISVACPSGTTVRVWQLNPILLWD